MNQVWDSQRISDQKRHGPSLRRRWSGELQRSTKDYPWWPSGKSRASAKKPHQRIGRVTKKESADVAKLLQLQSENFLRTLEIQSLRNSVAELLDARNKAEVAFRQFHEELKALELDTQAGDAGTLDYELSESDWLDIIGR